VTPDDIRQQFLDFFRSKGHTIVPSSPVVPHDDPTLMFANAGMNQFKPIFLGQHAPDVDKWPGVVRGLPTRAANSQKCIRAGGKHNDLDDVGQDTYHHTFFEMLGNWSFGDYFKKEAIEWAWDLLTKVWGIDKTRLHATYFGGLPAEPADATNPNPERERRAHANPDRNGGAHPNPERQGGAAAGVTAPHPNPERQRGACTSADAAHPNPERQRRASSAWVLEPDYEAHDLWLSVTDIDPSHVHPGSMKDNFWEMGDTGPCGPCSEIHIDLTPDKSGGPLVNAGDARVIEIWNLVFIQFNRGADRNLAPLPARHVDTGMGFERLCAVLEGQALGKLGRVTNYDTGVFTPIFEAIRKRTGAPKYAGTLPGQSREGSTTDQEMIDVSYRVIADHIRCLTFALTDGALPSNEGRGYVLRRILRRAVRYGRQYMNMHEPFLCDLVRPLIDHMSGAFPELKTGPNPKQPRDNVVHVAAIIRDEEESFGRTFDRGLKLYREEADYARTHHHGRISGEAAFKLHDTYGFTIDLTELMAEEDGLTINIGEYHRLMEEAREKARGITAAENAWDALNDPEVRAIIRQDSRPTRFVGYDKLDAETAITGVMRIDGASLLSSMRIREGQRGALLLSVSPFYVEKGGQVGDVGLIWTGSGVFSVERVAELDGRILHIGRCVRGELLQRRAGLAGATAPSDRDIMELGATQVVATASVDVGRRIPTMQNHTATHLLNWALRDVLGTHVDQKGSLVDPDKTRFDFAHNKPVSDDQMSHIEQLVTARIADGLDVNTNDNLPVDQKKAREINTLRAVFGEKYPDEVRVVSIGPKVADLLADPKNPAWMAYSVEFCGGTHVANTREIVDFVLTQEEGVAKGIRRVVGISGEAAAAARKRGAALVVKAEVLLRGDQPSEPRASARAESASEHRLQTGATLHSAITDIQAELSEAVIPLADRRRVLDIVAELQERLKQQQKAAAAESGGAVMDRMVALLAAAETIGGVTVVVGEVPPANADALRGAIDWVRNKTTASAVMLACQSEGKVTLIAGMSREVVARGLKAGDLIKETAPLVGGKGGGRPDMAQGGGTDAAGIAKALARATAWIREKCG